MGSEIEISIDRERLIDLVCIRSSQDIMAEGKAKKAPNKPGSSGLSRNINKPGSTGKSSSSSNSYSGGNRGGNRNGGGGGSSLYEEAGQVMAEISKKGASGGLRTIIYGTSTSTGTGNLPTPSSKGSATGNAKDAGNGTTRKSDPRQLYALVSSTLKFRDLLNEVIKASGMLRAEGRVVSTATLFSSLLNSNPIDLSRVG